MIKAYHAATAGLISQQNYLNTIGNNIANISTKGFKPQTTAFSTLLYENINGESGTFIGSSSGARVEKNGIDFTQGDLDKTGRAFDCAVQGKGFFAIQNRETGTTTYTRDGSFSMSVEGNQQYLVDGGGNYVLDANGNNINVTNGFDCKAVGVFAFPNPYGLELLGNNQYSETNGSGTPYAANESEVLEGYLEFSGTDVAKEMTRMIEASKAFSFNSKILQTTDEIEKVVNQLR